MLIIDSAQFAIVKSYIVQDGPALCLFFYLTAKCSEASSWARFPESKMYRAKHLTPQTWRQAIARSLKLETSRCSKGCWTELEQEIRWLLRLLRLLGVRQSYNHVAL